MAENEVVLTDLSIGAFFFITASDFSFGININVRRLGGAYGAKISRSCQIATACAVAAHTLNKPVRIVMKLETNMESLGKRNDVATDYEVGMDDDGKIQYLKADFYENNGSSMNEPLIESSIDHLHSCYDSSTWSVMGKGVRTDLPSMTYCRAPGSTEGIGFIENVMEHIAKAVNKDPIEVRLKNMSQENNPMAEMINDIKKSSNYDERKKYIENFNKLNRWKKRGMTLVPMTYPFPFWGNFSAIVSIYAKDGSVSVAHGGIECGQGINTKVAQVSAHILGIPLEMVSIKPSNTLTAPNGMVTGGSIASEACCYAAMMCCRELLKRMEPYKKDPKEQTWAQLVQASSGNLVELCATYIFVWGPRLDTKIMTMLNETIVLKAQDGNTLTVQLIKKEKKKKVLILNALHPSVQICENLRSSPKQFTPKDEVKPYNIWGVTVTEVEVDILTGQYQDCNITYDMQVLRVDIIEDAGKSLSPEVDIGQVEGAFVMGLGYWLQEQLVYNEDTGELLTNRTWNIVDDTQKRAHFLCSCGLGTLKILSDEFGARDLSEIPFVELIDRLTTRFAPRPNETVQYHLFTRRRQQIGESIDAFATDLRRIADGCGFGGEVVMEKMLRNQFVCGLADTQLQQQFFIKPDLTFKIAIEAAKAAEVARKYVEDVRDEATTHGAVYGIGSQPQYKSTFQRIRRQDTNRGSQPQVGNPPSSKVGSGQENRGRRARHFFPGQCLRCAGQHQTRRCTVDQNKLYCTVCDRRGHVESVCLSETRHGRNTARAHQVTDITEPHKQDSEELSIEGLELYNIKDVSKHNVPDTKRQPTMPAIKLSLRIDGMFHTMEVDTGAALTLISEETYKVLWPHQPKLESLDLDLRTWAADTPLRLLGSKLVEVQFKERRATLTLAVATGHGPSLLGRPWLEPLGLTVHGLNVVGNTLANTEQNPTSINSQQELPVLGYRTNSKGTVQNTLLTPSEVKDLNTVVQANYPKWTQGTVEKSLGEWMYEVTNKDGRRQRRHVDQLRQASESLQTGKQQYSPREQHMPVQLFRWEDTPVQQEPDQDQPQLLEQHHEMIPQREKSWEPGQTSGQNQQATQKRGRPSKEQQQQAPCLQPVNTKHPHQPLSLQLRGRMHEPPLLGPQRTRRPNPRYNYKPPGAKDIPIDFRIELRRNAPNPTGVLRSKDVMLNGTKQYKEKDSGAGLTVISSVTYEKIWASKPNLMSSNIQLCTWGTKQPLCILEPRGIFMLDMEDTPISVTEIARETIKDPVPFLYCNGTEATGEPPLCMSCSALFALKNALYSARQDAGAGDKWFQMNGPATVESVFLNSLTKSEQKTRWSLVRCREAASDEHYSPSGLPWQLFLHHSKPPPNPLFLVYLPILLVKKRVYNGPFWWKPGASPAVLESNTLNLLNFLLTIAVSSWTRILPSHEKFL
uniref:Uncharacterized protein n=1 Tax=Timema tahoe TaxID=61484 RepID=A0A7R9FLW1_9NEOP|nr:unnamed protein product [Timema tahoe]